MGGTSRLNYNLAKIPGHDVGICLKSTPEIMRDAQDSIHVKDKKKEDTAANRAELVVRSSGLSTTEGSGRGSTNSATERFTSFFVPRTGFRTQLSIMLLLKKGIRYKQITLWGGYFSRVTYLSTSPKTINFGSRCVMQLLLFVQGIKVLPMSSCRGQLFKKKKTTLTLDWQS
jgi:hypothetical protein